MAKKRRRIARIIAYSLIILLILGVVGLFIGMRKFNAIVFKESPNHLLYTYEAKPVSFEWTNDTINDFVETHTAMIIPLKLEGLPHKFYFQFDTGAPSTIIYGATLESLNALGMDIKTSIKDENSYVDKLDILLGGNQVKASMIEILEGYGNAVDKNDTINAISLGTLGADFMDKKITAIDFKNQHLQFYDKRPEWMHSLSGFKAFDFRGRRFMLPARIQDKELELFFDSGASTFGLITSKNRYDHYTNESEEEIRYDANKFGDPVPICHRNTNVKIKIGNADLSLRRISYVDMYLKYQRFMTPFTRIGGWLGNRPFIENTLILDTIKEEFVVIESAGQKQTQNSNTNSEF